MPYLEGETSGERAAVWLTYFILLNNYVPISLSMPPVTLTLKA